MGLFDIYTPSRSLPRGYEVKLIEGDYSLELPHRAVSTRPGEERLLKDIKRLGWNDRYIVIVQNHWRAGLARWTIIDLTSDSISEAMYEEDWAAMRKADSKLAAVTVYDIDEAWRRLD